MKRYFEIFAALFLGTTMMFSCQQSVCKEICIQTYLYTLQKFLHNTCISTFGDSLIRIFEIVIIISITQRQSFYDKCRQIFTLPAPLLPCISLYQFLIYVLSNQCKRLFLQVLRMGNVHSCDLFLYLRLCFCRSTYPDSSRLPIQHK